MKKFAKIIPMVMTLAIGSTALFAMESEPVSTVSSTSFIHMQSDNHLSLSENYPKLADYIVSINKSVEFGGVRFTVNEALVIDNKVQITATTEKLDGSTFEEGSGFNNVNLTKQDTSHEDKLAKLMLKLVNAVDVDIFDILSEEELNILWDYTNVSTKSYTSSSYFTQRSEDGTKLYHMNYTEHTPDADLLGETFVLAVSELGYHNSSSEDIDIDLDSLYEQTTEENLITRNNIEEIDTDMNLGYQLSDHSILERVQYFVNDDGENVLGIITKRAENNNISQYITLQVDEEPYPLYASSWNSGDGFKGETFVLGDYTLEDVRVTLNTHEYVIVNDERAEVEFVMPTISAPTVSVEGNLQVTNANNTVMEIKEVQLSPLNLSIYGTHTKEDNNYNTEHPDSVEILFIDGTTKELFKNGSSGSFGEGDFISFSINYTLGDVNLFDVEDVAGVIIQGETVLFE
ncbi:MAG: hypothetical protein ATN35_03025 [Epulopiscium sp. Nele67-Bin004]|nr:MAG: hypothetical protein ATN35_03025 [Epulopiscium sp. Nele67-Bin004]